MKKSQNIGTKSAFTPKIYKKFCNLVKPLGAITVFKPSFYYIIYDMIWYDLNWYTIFKVIWHLVFIYFLKKKCFENMKKKIGGRLVWLFEQHFLVFKHYTYFQKIQIILLKQHYQTASKYFDKK